MHRAEGENFIGVRLCYLQLFHKINFDIKI